MLEVAMEFREEWLMLWAAEAALPCMERQPRWWFPAFGVLLRGNISNGATMHASVTF